MYAHNQVAYLSKVANVASVELKCGVQEAELYLGKQRQEHSKREMIHGVDCLQISHYEEYGCSSSCKWPIHLPLLRQGFLHNNAGHLRSWHTYTLQTTHCCTDI